MKLLFDENLSRRLVVSLRDLFPGSSHVAFEELLSVPDARVWEHAKANGFAIVTADEADPADLVDGRSALAEHAVDSVRARFGDNAVVRGLAFEGPEES